MAERVPGERRLRPGVRVVTPPPPRARAKKFETFARARKEEGRALHPLYYAKHPQAPVGAGHYVDAAGTKYTRVPPAGGEGSGPTLALDFKYKRGAHPRADPRPGDTLALTSTTTGARVSVSIDALLSVMEPGRATGRVRVRPQGPLLD